MASSSLSLLDVSTVDRARYRRAGGSGGSKRRNALQAVIDYRDIWSSPDSSVAEWMADSRPWRQFALQSGVCTTISVMLCRLFVREDTVQWNEAIRVGFLPLLPSRLPAYTLVAVDETLHAVRNETVNDDCAWSAGAFVLLEAGLRCAEPAVTCPAALRTICELTASSGRPQLQIAHAIRSLAIDGRASLENLWKVVDLGDPGHREILQRSRLIDEPGAEEEPPRQQTKRLQGRGMV
jgi:hypothetical protein